jgi:hypothetical protein
MRYLEDDDDDEGLGGTSSVVCSSPICGETIDYADEVFLLSIAYPRLNGSGLDYIPMVADDGDYLYEPCFFCFECWEQILEDLRERTKDIPPVVDDYAVLDCDICESGIRQNELMGVVAFGEIQMSRRDPGTDPVTFSKMDQSPKVICIGCLNILTKDIAELWYDRVTQNNECKHGSFLRCWRFGCSADEEHYCMNEAAK